jgi:HEAT repeats/PBS lyase HEAT-like repeat
MAMKRTRWLLVSGGLILVFAVGVSIWWGWRESPAQKVPSLLREFEEQPTGKFEPFNFGRSNQAVHEDWDRLGPEAVPALIDALKNRAGPKRYLAAGRLGEIGDPRAVPVLIEALQDYDFIVRMWSANALGRFHDSRAVEALIPCLQDEASCVRSSAAKALGELGDGRAVGPLLPSLEDDDWWTRVEATTALGRLGDKRAVNPIRQVMARDKTDSIREEGYKALQRLGADQNGDP